ncbi:hypothetical protein [Synechococcus sp. WH 8016]|uniref:hypothetical protein n=1 Tax=Synechococcus sp. WH 8016 TaxID=166318 RepID=UPI00022DA18E|nr:hypothetical protein [Synechococcus sp. WH 8016]EHA64080.1 hypothetical protein Syn8016DRAFT_1122 [Synechococcus sp. WH 8016]
MQRLNPPVRFTILKEEMFWTLEFAEDKLPDAKFCFYVLRKAAEGSYESHGWASEPSEDFALRRELVSETGITNYFVRAKRVTKRFISSDGDDDSALDFFRDKHDEGVGIENIPRHLRLGYLAYCRGRRSAH